MLYLDLRGHLSLALVAVEGVAIPCTLDQPLAPAPIAFSNVGVRDPEPLRRQALARVPT